MDPAGQHPRTRPRPQLVHDMGVVAGHRPHPQDEHRHGDDHEVGTAGELGQQDDDEHQPGEHGADGVDGAETWTPARTREP